MHGIAARAMLGREVVGGSASAAVASRARGDGRVTRGGREEEDDGTGQAGPRRWAVVYAGLTAC